MILFPGGVGKVYNKKRFNASEILLCYVLVIDIVHRDCPTMPSVAVNLCLLLLCGATAVALKTIDTIKPLARLSPVRGAENDEFGFSVVAHRMDSSASGFASTLNTTL